MTMPARQRDKPDEIGVGGGDAETHVGNEIKYEALLARMHALAREVCLTQMPTIDGVACKATFVLSFLEERDGDFATELARSFAHDVLLLVAQTKFASCRATLQGLNGANE